MMARMLGMAVSSELTSAADFELVTRLEKLILNANRQSVPLDHAYSADPPRPHTESLPQQHEQPDDVCELPDSSRSCQGHITPRSRSRSLSPMRTRDSNIY